MDAVLPYRLVRRELGVDTSEDYEALILRLCAGEGGFVQADATTQAALQAEAAKPMPDLALLRVYGDTHVVLRHRSADRRSRRPAGGALRAAGASGTSDCRGTGRGG